MSNSKYNISLEDNTCYTNFLLQIFKISQKFANFENAGYEFLIYSVK